MELFIPSLIALLVAAIIIYIFLPKLSPYAIGILSLVLCMYGVWQHYVTFPEEYKTSTIQAFITDYAPFIMIAAIILAAMIATTVLSSGGSSNTKSVFSNILPMTPSLRPANNKGSMFNLGGNTKRNNLASTSFMTV